MGCSHSKWPRGLTILLVECGPVSGTAVTSWDNSNGSGSGKEGTESPNQPLLLRLTNSPGRQIRPAVGDHGNVLSSLMWSQTFLIFFFW